MKCRLCNDTIGSTDRAARTHLKQIRLCAGCEPTFWRPVRAMWLRQYRARQSEYYDQPHRILMSLDEDME